VLSYIEVMVFKAIICIVVVLTVITAVYLFSNDL
jgi:hypothetical protein